MVHVELTGDSGTRRFAEYSDFRIGSEADQYMLMYGSYLAASDVGEEQSTTIRYTELMS